MSSLNYYIHTFGCKVNTYDTGLLQKTLNKEGFVEFFGKKKTVSFQKKNNYLSHKHPFIHILNTCAVTQQATLEAGRLARKLKREDPHCFLVLTGCAAQVDTGFFKIKEIDLIVANSHKTLLPELIEEKIKGNLKEKVFKSNIFKKQDVEFGGGLESQHTRSFLKIQDGCNSFCTFCIIPFARGKSRSIKVRDLINQVNFLYEKGVREVVLTGVHIGDYRDSERENFYLEDLVESLLKSTFMPRIRLSSLEPIEISNRLLELYQEERICSHFHLSIQSANSSVLKMMKRKYGKKEVLNILETIYKVLPQAFVGMDIIAGFVGEGEKEFQDTYGCLKNTPWTRLHVFPYSPRAGTWAFHKEAPEEKIRRNRAHQLRQMSLRRYEKMALSQVGKVKKALFLKSHRSFRFKALSRDYWPIQWEVTKEENLKTFLEEKSFQIQSYEKRNDREGVLRGILAR